MKSKHAGVFSRRLRALAWVNIGIQACLPLAVAFTPAVVGASSFLRNPASPASLTQVYTLSAGETAASVAKKFGISVAELRKLNQLRTFAHGFDHLQPGDELDVPASPLAAGAAPGVAVPDDDAQAQRLAAGATQAGTFLASNPDGDAAASMARGMAVGEANREVQDWMSQFGTARVQLDADEHFSLKNSQLDLLVPLYEQQDLLAFTQGSLHRTDDRTQANLGVGARWFGDDWMFGGNTFLDHDLSREHTRMGVGVEYWRDYLKLGANSYLRLSNWKDSPDVEDYEERAANGWDIRAQGWLPALPQLGGKLTYEQYYGDEVGLFGKDHRQKDPHAITAGVEYTPIPLLTFSAEQRQGKGSESDTRFGVDFRYQLGTAWQQQVDPNAVQAMRSLAGSRHDLVERNNNIVLEYRKKELIRLRTAPLVTGYAKEKKSLGVTVNSNNGVDRIDWSAPALLAAGGQIVEDGPQAYSVVLPDYQFTQGVNNYTVTGVAVDKKGNRSNTSETQVSVHTPTASVTGSTFMPLSSALPADGKSTQTLTLDLRDEQGNPLDVPATDVIIDTGASKAARANLATTADVGEPVKTGPGVYTVTVTAGTTQETLVLTPVVNGVRMTPSRVVISATAPSGTTSTVTTDKTGITADGVDSLTVTFEAKDANNNPIPGIAGDITFKVVDSNGNPAPNGAVTVSPATEITPPGTYRATVTGTGAGNYTLIPEYNGTPVDSNLEVPIELKAGTTPDGTQSTLAAPSPASITADGTSTSTLSFTAKDAQGNLITGLTTIGFAVKDTAGNPVTTGVTVTPAAESPAGSGTYVATLSGTQAGAYTVVPQNGGVDTGTTGQTVTLTAGTTPDGTQSTFSADVGGIIPDGVDEATLTFTAKDVYGNAITGLTGLTFAVTPTTGATMGTVTDHGDGTYTAAMTSNQAGSYTVVPQVGGTPVSGLSETISVAAVATAVQDILVNGYTFNTSAGFPKTGFTGAKFTVQLNGGDPTDYTWTSTASWAPVDANGDVTFTGKGDSTAVTITATSKADPSKAFTYAFTLSDWYINNGSTTMTWSAANTWCTNQGAALATRLQLGGTQMTTGQYNVRGTVDSLWSEWGNLAKYTGWGSSSSYYTWTSEFSVSMSHYGVRLTTGYVGSDSDSNRYDVACRQGL